MPNPLSPYRNFGFSPRLMCRTNDPAGGGGENQSNSPEGQGTPPVPTPPASQNASNADADRGFPANTAIADMTVEQREAYWRHHSRRHEAEADEAKRKLADKEREALSDDERRERDRVAEAEKKGAEPFIASAVAAEIRASTGKTKEEVADLLRFVDVNKFLTDGALDDAKISDYAAAVGVTPAAAPTPPFNAPGHATNSMRRNSPDNAPAGESIADKRKKIAATLGTRSA